MLIESCAGLLDKDNAEDCICRETEEETGYQITHVRKGFEAYMSPGSVTEILSFLCNLFACLCPVKNEKMLNTLFRSFCSVCNNSFSPGFL